MASKAPKPKAQAKAQAPAAWLALALALAALGAALLLGGDANATLARLQSLPSRLLQEISGASEAIPAPEAVDCGAASAFLTDVMPVKGFHVLCVAATPSDTCVSASECSIQTQH